MSEWFQFLHYEGRVLGEMLFALKVTEENIEWLAYITKAELQMVKAANNKTIDLYLDFGDNNIAEVGDYVISGYGAYRPCEAEIFEANYVRAGEGY